jgi:hypothetical protein
LGERRLQDVQEFAQNRLVIELDDELREDHQPECLDGLGHFFLACTFWVAENVTYLSKYFTEVLPLLLVTVNLNERVFDLL